MNVIIQKPDLDTCLTALILGVSEKDEVIVLRGQAPVADLNDPAVCCIEAGGSGQTHLNNFDHHDPERYFPPACRQAFVLRGPADAGRSRLVDYVCMVDDRQETHPPVPFPSLSNIFSGMLFCEKKPLAQFYLGIEMLEIVLDKKIDPFGTMPDVEQWRPYRKAKQENMERLEEVIRRALFFTSTKGKKIGFSESDVIGGIGVLYQQGCDAVIMLNNAFGFPPVRKFTIAGNGIGVSHLLEPLHEKEEDWGGRDTIIGSPRDGSKLSKEQIIELVRKYL